MNNYEKVKAIINSGHYALGQYNNGEYIIFSSIKKDGDIRGSYIRTIIEDCLDYIGTSSHTEEYINKLISITPYPIKPKLFKVGDMVEILPIVKEVGDYEDWDNDKKQMIRGPFEIKGINDNLNGIICYIYNKDKSNYYIFPHYCVSAYLGEVKKNYSGKEFEVDIDGVKYKAKII